MKRGSIAIVCGLAIIGCAHHHNPARILNHRVDLWDHKTSTWALDHCVLVGSAADYGTQGHALSIVVGGNYTLYGERIFYFACPELPPWPRHDSKGVREDWAVDPREITCANRIEPRSANITTPGAGKPITRNSVVRVRLDRTEVNNVTAPMFHGRAPVSKDEQALATKVTMPAPVPSAPFVITAHVSCLACTGTTMLKENLHEGAKGTTTCADDGTWEFEVLAVGGEDLFERDLHLPATDD
jgi:hypothetical protein